MLANIFLNDHTIYLPASSFTDSCDFESGLCTWTQETNDRLDWLEHSGPTISLETGPNADHTLGTCKKI